MAHAYVVADLFTGVSGAYEIVIAIFGTVASLLIAVSYLPQLIQTYKTKGTTGISFWMWLLICIAEVGFSIWGILYIAEGNEAWNYEQLNALGYLYQGSATTLSGSAAHAAVAQAWWSGYDKVMGISTPAVVNGKVFLTAQEDAFYNAAIAYPGFVFGQAFYYGADLHLALVLGHNVAMNAGLVNGLALFVCDVFCGATACGIFFYKCKNMMMAKKEGISEAELSDRLYKEAQEKKLGKKAA